MPLAKQQFAFAYL